MQVSQPKSVKCIVLSVHSFESLAMGRNINVHFVLESYRRHVHDVCFTEVCDVTLPPWDSIFTLSVKQGVNPCMPLTHLITIL